MSFYGTGYNGNMYQTSPYNNFAQSQQQQQVQQFPMQQPMPQQVGLNGKIVDSEEMVKATEVPIGGYGIFPKADLSHIYVKTWNSNGTTSVVTYAAVPSKQSETTALLEDSQSKILSKIDALEAKLDSFLETKDNQPQQSKPIYPVSTGVKNNGF